MLFARIERRAQSTISHDWVYKLDPQKFQAVQMDYAFKSSMMKMSASRHSLLPVLPYKEMFIIA